MKLALVAALCILPAAAFAQSPAQKTDPVNGNPSITNSATAMTGRSTASSGATQTPLQAKVKKNLQAAGFKDIQIVPEGFIVNAKDQDGTPVTMLINPHSVAEFVGSNGHAASGSSSSMSSSSASPAGKAQ